MKKLIFILKIISLLSVINLNYKLLANNEINSQNLIESKKEETLKTKSKNFTIEDFLIDFSFLIGPGDILSIDFVGYEELSGDFKVINDGNINLPLVNFINLNNLSIIEAQNKIRDAYKDELVSTEIFLSVKVPRPISVAVLGEVNKPGIYFFNDIEINNQTTNPKVVDAIRLADGITEKADAENIIFRRKASHKRNYDYKETKLDILNLYKTGNQQSNLYLFDGDVIEIKRLTSDNLINQKLVNSNIMRNTIKVSVIGEVKSPGELILNTKTPISQAIYKAGGPINYKANIQKIELVRMNKKGQVYSNNFKLNLSQNISKEKNPILKDGDIVIVKTSKIAKGVENFKFLTSPLRGISDAINIINFTQN